MAWFVPQHEELKVQDGESLAKTAGRVFGDTIALGIAASEIVGGDAMMGGGAAGGVLTCVETLGGGCVVGAAVVAGGVVVEGAGVVTGGNAIANGAKNLNDLISMVKSTELEQVIEFRNQLANDFGIEQYQVKLPGQ